MATLIPCTVCPMGCEISVEVQGETILSVTGHQCPRGDTYARHEALHPERVFTGSVKVLGGDAPVVSVRSAEPIPRDLLMSCAQALKGRQITAPVRMHDVVWDNILDTGVKLVATAEVDAV